MAPLAWANIFTLRRTELFLDVVKMNNKPLGGSRKEKPLYSGQWSLLPLEDGRGRDTPARATSGLVTKNYTLAGRRRINWLGRRPCRLPIN
ncbi:tRNA (guanine-N(1)-)-methyltransferase [Trichinella pseudospiralis]